MLLTIIIPMYNVEKYVEKCISSVLDNDLEGYEYEIIIVDDESPDNSLPLVRNRFGHLHHVRIISQRNLGLGGARNTGIRNAFGEYLLFLDSDDWVLPRTLKNLVETASSKKVDFLEFAAQGIDPEGNVVYHYSNSTGNIVLDGVTYYNSVRYMNSACNKLYRLDFLLSNSLFFLERIFIEDFEFNTRVLLAAKRVMATDQLVSQYLQSPESITRTANSRKQQKMVNDILHVLEITRNLYTSRQQDDSHVKSFFLERSGFIVATLFYQLFKNRASFKEIVQLRAILIAKGLFYVDFPLHQRSKNLFRIFLLKNFLVFRFAHFIYIKTAR